MYNNSYKINGITTLPLSIQQRVEFLFKKKISVVKE